MVVAFLLPLNLSRARQGERADFLPIIATCNLFNFASFKRLAALNPITSLKCWTVTCSIQRTKWTCPLSGQVSKEDTSPQTGKLVTLVVTWTLAAKGQPGAKTHSKLRNRKETVKQELKSITESAHRSLGRFLKITPAPLRCTGENFDQGSNKNDRTPEP